MTKSSTPRNAIWFYPIRGLLLKGDGQPDDKSFFPHGDLWTKEETIAYIENVRHKSPDYISQLQDAQWDSCIVVNYRSNIFLEDEQDLVWKMPYPSHAAREVASEYLSALHFCVMTHASSQSRCVFADTLPAHMRSDVCHDIALNQLSQQGAGMDMGSPVELTRSELMKHFDDPRQNALLSIHFDPADSQLKAVDVRKALASSTRHLSNSCHQWSETDRLLTAVTAIEMLMSTEVSDSNYAKLQNRISALLGRQIAAELDIAETFKARHKYVHHGEDCASSKKALNLAATCQVNFANLAIKLQSKKRSEKVCLRETCLQYLDLLYQQEKLSLMELETKETFEAVSLSDLS